MNTEGYCTEFNIKSDMPTVDEALRRVRDDIVNARHWGCAAIKFIHGYGSTGKGGRIRPEVRRYLEELRESGRIRDYIPGERFSIFDESTRRALAAHPALRQDRDLERANNGVTIVIL